MRPARVAGTCGDCGTTMTLEHPDGLSGDELPWRCPVCLGVVSMAPAPTQDRGTDQIAANNPGLRNQETT